MKYSFLALAFAIAACSSTAQKAETLTPCAGITASCGGEGPKPLHVSHKVRGLSADRTVQLMLQVGSPTLIGGKPADASEWPASVYAHMQNAACSATLVGDRVLFMASHCMDNGAKVSFSAHANQYTARCTHHPEYAGNSTADWALCLVDRPVTGVPFEVFGTEKTVKTGDTLRLTGYGCIKPGGGGGNDGIFRIGLATVKGTPGGKSYDIVTKGGAALCFGDSGGSAYVEEGKDRYVIGVNSRGDISSTSYLPAVYSRTFVQWAETWAKTNNNVRVCGIHSDALGCRQGEAEPQPDGKFEVNAKAACLKGVVAPSYLKNKDDIVEALRQVLGAF